MSEHVRLSYYEHVANKWKIQIKGKNKNAEPEVFENRHKKLPRFDFCGRKISYLEFDVNDLEKGQKRRDSQRFVVGDDGSIYFTGDHYGTFIKIK